MSPNVTYLLSNTLETEFIGADMLFFEFGGFFFMEVQTLKNWLKSTNMFISVTDGKKEKVRKNKRWEVEKLETTIQQRKPRCKIPIRLLLTTYS